MRAKFADALGTPIVEILNGIEVKLSLLTLGDLAAFERYVEGKAFRLLAENLKDFEKTDTATIEQVITQALNKVIRPTEDESNEFDNLVGKEMVKPSGMQFLLWLSMRKHDPEISLEEVGTLITINNLDKIGMVINRLTGMEEVPNESPPPTKEA